MTRVVLTRDQLLSAPGVNTPVDVPLPELGEGVVVPVWPMTAKEWTEFQNAQVGKDGKPNAKAKIVRERLVIHCCRNDDGSPIFQPDDVKAIGEKKAGLIERLVNKSLEVSGITGNDVDALAKNSDETQGD